MRNKILINFKDLSTEKQIRIVELREQIVEVLNKQSMSLFESDWQAAMNQCEEGIEIFDMLNSEIYEASQRRM